MSQLEIYNAEIAKEISKKEVATALLETTFKGLDMLKMRQALLEGMMRGFSFKDFLEKNIYAIPFKSSKTNSVGYSLVTSIDYARKIAMRSGLAGKSEPKYVEKDKQLESCTITIKRNVAGVSGDYTATVYFREYSTGYNLWATKPYTMLAKVAEAHALRSAFPEEMAKVYLEEELQKENSEVVQEINAEEWEAKLKACQNIEEVKSVWATMPVQAKEKLKVLKDEIKLTFTKNENSKI